MSNPGQKEVASEDMPLPSLYSKKADQQADSRPAKSWHLSQWPSKIKQNQKTKCGERGVEQGWVVLLIHQLPSSKMLAPHKEKVINYNFVPDLSQCHCPPSQHAHFH